MKVFLPSFTSMWKTLTPEEEVAQLVAERLIRHQSPLGSLTEWSEKQMLDCLVIMAMQALRDLENNPEQESSVRENVVTLYSAAYKCNFCADTNLKKIFDLAKERLAKIAEKEQVRAEEARAAGSPTA